MKYSSLGLATARLVSTRPSKNPVVFLDIDADGEPLGRITIEVASLAASRSQRHSTCKLHVPHTIQIQIKHQFIHLYYLAAECGCSAKNCRYVLNKVIFFIIIFFILFLFKR